MASPGTASLRRCETSLRKSSPRLFFSSRCLAIAPYCLTMHSLCSSSALHIVSSLRRSNSRRIFSIPCHRSSLLPWPLQNNALLIVSFAVTSLRYSFAFAKLCLAELLLRHISRRFSSCVACQHFAIASPSDASCCFCFSSPHHACLLLCALARVSVC